MNRHTLTSRVDDGCLVLTCADCGRRVVFGTDSRVTVEAQGDFHTQHVMDAAQSFFSPVSNFSATVNRR